MSEYRSKVNSYNTPKGVKWRVEYAYKTPDGIYHRSCKRGFDTEKIAELWEKRELFRLIEEKEKEKPPVPAPTIIAPALKSSKVNPLETMTMDELIAEYIKLEVSGAKASTQTTKLNIINKKILPYFTGRRVIDIKTVDVKNWLAIINQMETAEGYGLADTYKYTIQGQLNTIFNYAMEIHELPVNPLSRIKKKIGKKYADKQEFWELKDYALLRNVAAEKPKFFYYWELLYWTGMRCGEAKAIRYSDILWDKKVIRIYKTLSNANVSEPTVKLSKKKAKKLQDGETDPKANSSYRDIHLPQILVDELKEYVDSIYDFNPNDYLFNLSKSSLHRELDRCIAETGVPDITVHGFRHSANSLLSNVVRCPDVVRKYRLGHCDETTNDIYNHPYKYGLEEVATKLNELMEGIDNVSEEY